MTRPTVAWLCALSAAIATGRAQPPDNAVALDLGCVVTDPLRVDLHATFRNTGSTDTAVVLGFALANGRAYLENNLVLSVMRGEPESSRSTEVQTYTHSDRTVPGIAGRLDPWVVPLPTRAIYSLIVPSDDFFANSEPLSATQPMSVQLRLDTRAVESVYRGFVTANTLRVGDIPFKVFTGDLRSNWLRIPTECVPADDVSD